MKRMMAALLALALVAFLGTLHSDATAQTLGKGAKGSVGSHGPIDSDGDGIPNGQDPDYTKPANGSGNKFGKMNAVSAYLFGLRHEWMHLEQMREAMRQACETARENV